MDCSSTSVSDCQFWEEFCGLCECKSVTLRTHELCCVSLRCASQHQGPWVFQKVASLALRLPLPFKNGKIERQVGLIKAQVALALEGGVVVQSVHELTTSQLVFEHSPRRWFHELLAEDTLDTDTLALDGHKSYAKRQELRQAALTLLTQLDSKIRVQRASRARSRTTQNVQSGHWCVCFASTSTRQKMDRRSCHHSCALVNVRKTTTEDIDTVSAIQDTVKELSLEVDHRGRRRYTYINKEAPWDDEEGQRPSASCSCSRRQCCDFYWFATLKLGASISNAYLAARVPSTNAAQGNGDDGQTEVRDESTRTNNLKRGF
eukprot:4447216-Amphidinium_carterae.1